MFALFRSRAAAPRPANPVVRPPLSQILLLVAAAGLSACADATGAESAVLADEFVPFDHARPALDETAADGRAVKRAIIHLHSPISHDACDGHTMEDAPCFADLRAGLCNDAVDAAFFTDHPSAAAEKTYEELFNLQEGDEVVDGLGSRMTCETGHQVLSMPGIEDELMPVGLDRHVADSPAENDSIYNAYTAESMAASVAAGGFPLQAHTEGQTIEVLLERQTWGQRGTEIFNLHAMVDPNKREDDLGLDGLAYLTQAGPFISGDSTAEPDLVFLAFYEEQTVSLERWDALNAIAPSLGTGGTDAHENALPMLMSDGERVDSYRRMMAWFSNYLVVSETTPAGYQAALEAHQTYLVFDSLGIPTGFDVAYGDVHYGTSAESPAVGANLVVTCPTLASTSPRDGQLPEITATVFRNGAIWQSECGTFAVTESGVYRVRIEILPHHLTGFLADQADILVHAYPWVYSQAFRIGL